MSPSGSSTPPPSVVPPAVGGDPSPIDCETAVRRLWDFLDGELPGRPHAEVEAHLRACDRCPPHFHFSARVQRALRDGSAPPPPRAEEEAALRRRVRAALATLAAAGAPPDDGR